MSPLIARYLTRLADEEKIVVDEEWSWRLKQTEAEKKKRPIKFRFRYRDRGEDSEA